MITRYPQPTPVPNWRDINIAPEVANSTGTEVLSFSMFSGSRLDQYLCPLILANSARQSCIEGLSHPNYQNFLKEDHHFDVILIEVFNTPCFMGITKKFNAPVIGLTTGIAMPWMHKWFGTDTNPSYVPNHFLANSDRMDFLTRVENTLMHLFTNLIYTTMMDHPTNQIAKEYTGVDVHENGDVMSNISLLLINTHYSFTLPYLVSPNYIEIGGINVINQPLKSLPQDIEQFIKESKHGVIYMSMGSVMKGETFPEDKKQAFIRAFSRFPQRIIWKWEGEMKNKPDNIMTYRWTPQREILCHPNMKVYVSHGGSLGTSEAIDCGKPILILPIFGDQFINAKAIEQSGGGLTVNLNDVTEEIIYETLQKLLSPKYRDSAKELSKRFKDRPLSPVDTSIYWIEYVVRHKGAPFMKLASVDMPLYQYYLLDVIAFLGFFVIIYLYMSYLFVKFICRKLFAKKQKIKRS